MPFSREISIGKAIRELRENQGLAQIQLSKQSGVDPRTLAAIEKGRIITPSLASLMQIAESLGVTLKDLFGRAEARSREALFLGNQRGEFVLEWPRQRFRIVSYLPKSSPLFIGKVILENKGLCDSKTIPFQGLVFLQIIFGKIEFHLEDTDHYLKEGQHIFFDGRLDYSLQNPALREATALLVTQPSMVSDRRPPLR